MARGKTELQTNPKNQKQCQELQSNTTPHRFPVAVYGLEFPHPDIVRSTGSHKAPDCCRKLMGLQVSVADSPSEWSLLNGYWRDLTH